MIPEQERLMGAASKKSAITPTITKKVTSRGSSSASVTPKKLFVLNKPEKGETHRAAQKNIKAVLTFVRAQYQKGDKENQLTGAVYFQAKPRYFNGTNDKFKQLVGAKMLSEQAPRFNTELKLYTGKVWAPEQAIMIKEEMKKVSERDAKDLDESAPTDAEITEPSTFRRPSRSLSTSSRCS